MVLINWRLSLAALAGVTQVVASFTSTIQLPPLPSGYFAPGLPVGPPLAAPDYMVNNEGNTHKAAPDQGVMNGPVTSKEQLEVVIKHKPDDKTASIVKRQSSNCDSWICGVEHGNMPLAPDGYQFFRNVKDFGAKGDGSTDDTEAINRAASAFSSSNTTVGRCDAKCASTTTLGAIVYFPPGTYIVSTPIIQYYYSQFIGDPNNKPTIKGSANFTGIAVIDTDVYIPGGGGAEWYINQNQFFRQIRNFKIDLTAMPRYNFDNGQRYVPTGIHWQVAQATSMQNIDFNMLVANASGSATAVGIFMENGSGGFLSDLTFFGGNIGFRAGSQQYTARNLSFTSCLTAISMIWNWGFTWKDISVTACHVAIDTTSVGGIGNQGTGSLSVLDSHFNNVPYPITVRKGGPNPGIVLDNLLVENSASVVLVMGGETLVEGSTAPIYFSSWAMGNQYTSLSGKGGKATGFVNPAPKKPQGLLDGSNRMFTRSRPQYADKGAGSFTIVTAHGIANDGSGDQTDAINKLLSSSIGTPVFFPAGIYQVKGTVNVPVGSIIVGHGWSQIRGTGSYFNDTSYPQVMVKVGNPGDKGIIEISDMLFTVKGSTAGAVLMEWNVHESTQGSAGMWDSHFRVGGAAGSDLQLDDCPKTGNSTSCMAASLMLHVTSRASGYFENVWVWTADHDLDNPKNALVNESPSGVPLNVQTNVNIYTGRGVLIESKGPSWFYGSASEHSVLYQYQLYGAENIFLGHMQTESPYFQSTPGASKPYKAGSFPQDPKFGDCDPGSTCEKSWALRIINSKNILIYSAGLYSFFQNWDQSCIADETCQSGLIETSYSQGLWMYNIFTVGAEQVVSPRGGIPPTLQKDNQAGFSTEVTVWLVLALGGADLGGDGGLSDGSQIVYIDPTVFLEPSPTVGCWPPCTLVFPPSTIPFLSTIDLPPITTTITVNTVTTVTTITVSKITTSVISFWPWRIPNGKTSTTSVLSSSLRPPPIPVTLDGTTTTLTLPAYTGVGPSFPFSVSGKAQPTSTDAVSIIYYSLPTTVVTSGTITQTFSEDQIQSLSTLRTTTQSTTVWSQSGGASTTTTTTVIPIFIQTGGFYWSPIPLPGPTPFPIKLPDVPDLPKFPPIPSPPCFKLFDLFSIDCPPDKAQPTTHFTSHAPTPTCKSHCGTIDKDNEEESSICKTETNTDCHTICTSKPCQTVCNTYIGCACPTKTVTDYWVSCSKSSCTTTSSAVITGCYVTPTKTTTGQYCPAGVTIGPEDPQNEPLPANSLNSYSKTQLTKPESVVINGTPYTVTGGSIVVSGTTIPVPSDVSDPVTTDVGKYIGTIIPGYTGPVIVANSTMTVTDWGSHTATITTPAPGHVTTKTITTTFVHPTLAGFLKVAAGDYTVPGPRVRSFSNYWLFYQTRDKDFATCGAGHRTVFGSGTPKPAHWDDIPQTVSLKGAIKSYKIEFSNCVYRNPAAPAMGDGGKIECADLPEHGCIARGEKTWVCNADDIFGPLTRIKEVAACAIYEATTDITTYTTVVTES